jgi:hypothetical protein
MSTSRRLARLSGDRTPGLAVRQQQLPRRGKKGACHAVCDIGRLRNRQRARSRYRLAGAYLDEIGKTDIAMLSGDEWREFLRRIIVGFEQAMRRKILENEAPF